VDSTAGTSWLAEDVFDFVEDGGIAVSRFVLYFESGAELFQQFALLAREFRRREHADVIVEIALAAAARVCKPFALDAEHGAALGAFGNFEFFFPSQTGNLQLASESGLRDAKRNRAIKIGAAAFKEWMFLDVEDNIEIARRAPIGRRRVPESTPGGIRSSIVFSRSIRPWPRQSGQRSRTICPAP
jgi:hypothetical protein